MNRKRLIRRLAAPVFVLLLSSSVGACSSGNGVNCVQLPSLSTTICV